MRSPPKVSVVIACVNGLPSIGECLTALVNQNTSVDYEVVVANCCHDGTIEHVNTRFPEVTLLNYEDRRGIPQLRADGIEVSQGKIIAILEDHCLVPENWIAIIADAHHSDYGAIGGPVENGSTDRLIDWAVYLCEYSALMPPIPGGETKDIAGNNAAYKRDALQAVDEETLRNCWEYFIHQEMREAGVRFRSRPDMVVRHKKEFGFLYFLTQRFHYSRSFAGMRRREIEPSHRLLHTLASPLLAPLMLYRVGRQVLRKQRHVGIFVKALPFLIPFMISYAVGEGVGYLMGPGQSLLNVE